METDIRDFPEEIIISIKTLNGETRRKLVLSLLDKDARSYSQIKNEFNIKKGTLNHHLLRLVSAGLIRNFTRKVPESQYTSFYELTDFGRKFIGGLCQTLKPPVVQRTITHQSTTTISEQWASGSIAVSDVAPVKADYLKNVVEVLE